jgi:hypothetical protein
LEQVQRNAEWNSEGTKTEDMFDLFPRAHAEPKPPDRRRIPAPNARIKSEHILAPVP